MRVWFNHWFSTAYNIIELIKKDNESFYFIGSNRVENAVMRSVCDEWYVEPKFKQDSEEYLKYCLDFCKMHEVDVFIPHYSRVIISKNKHLFEKMDIRVLVDDYELVSLLDDKVKTYEKLSEIGVSCIPDYMIAYTEEEFFSYVRVMQERHGMVCCKKVKDIGAQSFKVLDVKGKLSSYLAVNNINESPILIMPYFKGDEISVDCLTTNSGNIMIPRRKGKTRIEHIEYKENVLSICDSILNSLDIKTPCNIQFITDKDSNLYLLEINPRMSGGLYMSCEGANINIPSIAVSKLLGVDVSWMLDKSEKYISHIETPIIIA